MGKISRMEWDIIDARVKSVRGRHRLSTDSKALLSITLEQIFPGTANNLSEVITDGSDDRGVDAIHFVESETDAEIYIFQSKYRDSIESSSKTINDNEILKISLFLNELFERSDTLANCHNFRLNEAVNRIWQLHEDGKICRYRVICCSNGAGFAASAQNIIDSIQQNHQSVQFEFYGASNIISGMALEGRKQESGSLQVIGKEILERSDGDVRGVIASVDARSFISLITTDDGYAIKRNLFDDNLRIFLGAKGGYNTSIIATATSPDSYLFWYLNNGITITCKNFSYNKGHVNPIIKFDDFQIVNGAQTSHSLVEAARFNSEFLNDVVLMVRLYATDRIDIADRVAVATAIIYLTYRRPSRSSLSTDREQCDDEHYRPHLQRCQQGAGTLRSPALAEWSGLPSLRQQRRRSHHKAVWQVHPPRRSQVQRLRKAVHCDGRHHL